MGSSRIKSTRRSTTTKHVKKCTRKSARKCNGRKSTKNLTSKYTGKSVRRTLSRKRPGRGGSDSVSDDPTLCVICMEDNGDIRIPCCRNFFHAHCLETWCNRNTVWEKKTCPICRSFSACSVLGSLKTMNFKIITIPENSLQPGPVEGTFQVEYDSVQIRSAVAKRGSNIIQHFAGTDTYHLILPYQKIDETHVWIGEDKDRKLLLEDHLIRGKRFYIIDLAAFKLFLMASEFGSNWELCRKIVTLFTSTTP